MSSGFTVLRIKGNNLDLGRAIGEQFRDRIKVAIELSKGESKNWHAELLAIAPFVTETKKLFPELLTEVGGISEGAGIGFEEAFLLNCYEIHNPIQRDPSYRIYDRCTIALSLSDDRIIVGHNEDWMPEGIEDLYILDAEVNGVKILGLNYCTEMPGNSANINNFGLIICTNYIHYENDRRTLSVPGNFLARAILESPNIDSAVNLINDTPQSFGINYVIVQGTRATNIEVGGSERIIKNITDATYAHTNHYRSAELSGTEIKRTDSSMARLVRAQELLKPAMDITAMKDLLTDSKNIKYPICRPDETIGSAIFDSGGKTVFICRGHPCSGDYKEYKI